MRYSQQCVHPRSIRRHAGSRRIAFEPLEQRLLLDAHPLANAGFESPELNSTSPWSASVSGWTTTAPLGIAHWSNTDGVPAASEGDQYLIAESGRWSISQAGPIIDANTRYYLTVDVFALDVVDAEATLRLLGGSRSTLATAILTPTSGDGQGGGPLRSGDWTTVVLRWNSATAPNSVGQQLTIELAGASVAVDNVRLEVDAARHDFFVSSSAGTQNADGFSPIDPLRSFGELQSYLPLLPGERVLLKAGDTFTEELNLRGKGQPDALVELSRYGTGDNPSIRRADLTSDVGVIWNNASHARISGIDVEHAKLGVYLRYEYTDEGSENVTIEDSNFRGLTDPTLDPGEHNYEYAWSDAIWVGGQAWAQAEFATRLDGLTIRNVTAERAAHLFGTGWYHPGPYMGRIRNLLIEDCVAIDNLGGSFQLFDVDGGIIRRVKAIGGGGQDTWSGTTLGFIQNSRNVLIEENEFSYIDRAQSADGSGMDFEGNTENVTFRNNTIHNNAGSALLILSTGGPNKNLVIENNTFYNNARDPWNSEINSEIQGSFDDHTGIIRNNTILRGEPNINFFSPNADWSGFAIYGNQEGEFASVEGSPTSWDFNSDGDLQGWNSFTHWAGLAVESGTLVGQSSGNDAYALSPPTWANSNELPFVWVRMSSTVGSLAQLFFTTTTDSTWNPQQSVYFSVTPDGVMRDYFVELDSASVPRGVVTQLRIDPTIFSGSDLAIDFIGFAQTDDPTQPLPQPENLGTHRVTVTSIPLEDGYAIESSQNSGVGGAANTSSSTFRLGDDQHNRAYRQFLSFDTSMVPDNAIITEATIGITRVGGPVGQVPIGIPNSVFGDILVDIATPSFGGTPLLASSDWQSDATRLGVSKFAWPAYLEGQTIFSRLDESYNNLINRTGKTQFRIRYQFDDDNDSTADYMSYATGDHSNPAYRPTLTIKYTLSAGAEAVGSQELQSAAWAAQSDLPPNEDDSLSRELRAIDHLHRPLKRWDRLIEHASAWRSHHPATRPSSATPEPSLVDAAVDADTVPPVAAAFDAALTRFF